MTTSRFLVLLLALCASVVFAQAKPPPGFEHALDLIHAFSGAGNELQRAMQTAQSLSKSNPGSGYAETLEAEMLSTWQLNQRGEPITVLTQIMQLTDRALALNPRLAHAHVARGRALLRASRIDEATAAIDAALNAEPGLVGAYFLRAEIYRRNMRVSDAETWYLKFIAETPSAHRKSNAYYWLARTYQDAASPTRSQEYVALIAKARNAHEKSVELDPDGAWKNANFAWFLNGDGNDFPAAERHAAKALSIMDFQMARYQLAIARYQQLMPYVAKKDDAAVKRGVDEVVKSTGISLDAALEFSRGSRLVPTRLAMIRQAASRSAITR
jgi:tetratricopeptide (TPR) repeat protein